MESEGSTKVADQLRRHTQQILDVWGARVRDQLPAAREQAPLALVDAVPDVLDELAQLIATAGTDRELRDAQATLAVHHGKQRAQLTGYSLDQVILEYQLLRTVILETLDADEPASPATRDLITDVILLAVRNAASEFVRLRGATTATELRESDVRFRHMVEAVRDYAIFTMDPAGYITSWNAGCMRMKHYTAEEAIGAPYSILYPEEGRRRDEPTAHLRAAAIEGRYRGEGVRLRKNGELFLADVSITAIYEEGNLTGFTKVVQDLTERNALIQERDLSRSDTVTLRAEAEYRERFVETLTHDLRTPLAAAQSGAELIAQFPDDGANVAAWSKRIADSLERAARMITNLLDASRLHAGEVLPMEIEPCEIREIIDDLCAEISAVHDARFSIEGSATGFWSSLGLRRVLDNLLSNAVKYGDPGRAITVRVRRIDNRVLVSVHNFGTIIPVEEQASLFRPFHRTSHAQSSGKPGWGIGLTLVKGIVEAHGGIVKAESYPKEGTTFTIDLPIDSRSPTSA